MSELLPCPFCGGENISAGETLTTDIAGETVTQSVCMDCGAAGSGTALADGEIDYGDLKAIAAWNKRAQSQQPAAAPVSGDVALPVPKHRGPDGTGSYFDSYTAEQMRTYGQQCSDAGFEAGKRLAHEQALLVTHRLIAERDAAIRALKGGE